MSALLTAVLEKGHSIPPLAGSHRAGRFRRALLSRCALLHEMLTELEPRYLRRYGALNKEAADYLEEKVGGLQERVEALGRSARRRG